jgi:hypothetical protein
MSYKISNSNNNKSSTGVSAIRFLPGIKEHNINATKNTIKLIPRLTVYLSNSEFKRHISIRKVSRNAQKKLQQ